MPDTVEGIERQIQKLIQQKKLVSDALNLVHMADSSQSTVSKTRTTSSKQSSSPRGKQKSS